VTTLTNRSNLLYIGNDPTLSKASSALLRSAGYKVRTTNPSHAAEAIREGRYSAVILCATLSAEEMNLVVHALQAGQADVPIICVQVGMLGEGPHPACSLVIDAMQGPNAFVGGVRSITTTVRQRAS